MTTHQNMLWEMMTTLTFFSTLVMIHTAVTGAFADMLTNPLVFSNYATQETWADDWARFYVRRCCVFFAPLSCWLPAASPGVSPRLRRGCTEAWLRRPGDCAVAPPMTPLDASSSCGVSFAPRRFSRRVFSCRSSQEINIIYSGLAVLAVLAFLWLMRRSGLFRYVWLLRRRRGADEARDGAAASRSSFGGEIPGGDSGAPKRSSSARAGGVAAALAGAGASSASRRRTGEQQRAA